jgi:hypothetical protein
MPDVPNESNHKHTGWDYQVLSNTPVTSYSLRASMGKGVVEYEAPNWVANNEGQKTIVPDFRIAPSLFNIWLNLLQVALIATTSYFAPSKMRPRWAWYIAYTISAVIVWLAFQVFSSAWWPEPGIAGFMLGFLCWVIGTWIYIDRIRRLSEVKYGVPVR